MTGAVLVPAAAGAALGAGMVAVAYAAAPPPDRQDGWGATAQAAAQSLGGLFAKAGALRAAGGVAAGAVVWGVTGWPVGAVLAAAAAWWLPVVLGPDRALRDEGARGEAVAAWAEQLRDLMAGAAGLSHAITATAPVAAAPIREAVHDLAAALRSGAALEEALAVWARRVDHPTADLVAVALSMAERGHAADLGQVLGRLAEAARDRARMLGRTSAARARVRSAVRIIAATSAVMVAAMIALNRGYLEPFDTGAGQVVLAGVGVLWAGGFAWLHRLSLPEPQPRLLAPAPGTRDEVAR